ncbi:Uncharacterized protein SCG7086_AA_00240 [Chlamydiales bacterium SCGC AG-110-P3]|nr:Uncharacterized protein SCG7086_AA_00240 [Chlamydiales bacterium SCGC AG-110-P3]
MQSESWQRALSVLDELVEYQRQRLLREGRKVVPTLTPEDMLQPNDYPELENNPEFRYEEGVFAGMLSAQMAVQAASRDAEAVSDSS